MASSRPAGQPPVAAPRTEVLGLLGVVGAVTSLSAASTIVKTTHLPGSVVGFWRMVMSAVVWHGYLWIWKRRRVTAEQWRAAFLPGLCFGLNVTLFFTGLTHTRVANAEFIGTLSPLLVVPFAAWRLGEDVRRRTIARGALALCGVALIVLFSRKGGNHSWFGDALCGLGMLSWTTYMLVSRHVRQRLDTPVFMGGISVVSSAVLFVPAVSTGGLVDVRISAWLLIALLALANGVIAHGLLAWTQQHVPVSTISLLQLCGPALGTTWALLFLGESVRPVQVAGMALMLVSVGGIFRGAVKAANRVAPRAAGVPRLARSRGVR